MAVVIFDDAPERGALAEVVKQLNKLRADLDAARTKFNAHTHSANDTAVIAGQQFAAVTAETITLKK